MLCESYGNDPQNVEEVSLWLGIIKTCVDSFFRGDKVSREWLFSKEHEEEFQRVCDLANIDSGYMRRKIREREKRDMIKKEDK